LKDAGIRNIFAGRILGDRPMPRSQGGIAIIRDTDLAGRRQDALRRDFVANVSHELKTPAGALALIAETMIGEDDPEVLHRLAERMLSEADRLNLMIEDLLDFSRIELEERPRRAQVSLQAIVFDAVERAAGNAHARDIRLSIEQVPADLVVNGSRRQLASALGNLIENAVKYSPEHGTVSLTVRGKTTSVDIRVADSGIGIAASDVPRIFERFYRTEGARAHDAGGAGLGLAIVRQVARDHDGEVLVSSRQGRGSTFTLRLPICIPANVATIETI
jgi:two-component system, OmpR family, sensor histidine kinase SenX3